MHWGNFWGKKKIVSSVDYSRKKLSFPTWRMVAKPPKEQFSCGVCQIHERENVCYLLVVTLGNMALDWKIRKTLLFLNFHIISYIHVFSYIHILYIFYIYFIYFIYIFTYIFICIFSCIFIMKIQSGNPTFFVTKPRWVIVSHAQDNNVKQDILHQFQSLLQGNFYSLGKFTQDKIQRI